MTHTANAVLETPPPPATDDELDLALRAAGIAPEELAPESAPQGSAPPPLSTQP
jgi:hypothetical protein